MCAVEVLPADVVVSDARRLRHSMHAIAPAAPLADRYAHAVPCDHRFCRRDARHRVGVVWDAAREFSDVPSADRAEVWRGFAERENVLQLRVRAVRRSRMCDRVRLGFSV